MTARFLKGILLSHASYACDHTHTPIHTHTLQTIEATGQIPTPPACSTPLSTIARFFAGAAEQHGKTAAPPANARPSPRVAGRTQPSIHAAGGEKSPPAHGRTDARPSHALHSSPLDTPASTRARRLDDGQRPPPHHAQRLRPTLTPHAQQQLAPRRPTETLQCMASARPRSHPPPADTAPTEPTAVVYESVEITSPADGGTVTNPSGNILVLFTLAPALREGDSTRLLIDGMPGGMPAEGGLLAPTTSRGEHRLEVQVLDAAGTVLATSAPVYVTVFRNPVRDKPGRPPRSN